MLQARLLGTLEFTRDSLSLPVPAGRALEVLVFLASSTEMRRWAELEAMFGSRDPRALLIGLEAFAPDLEVLPEGLLFQGGSDVAAYRAVADDLKALSRLRGEFAPGLESANPAVQDWLERERFGLHRLFLAALLGNAAGLEARGRRAEGEKNLEFVMRARASLPAPFAAELNIDLARYHWRLNRPERAAELLSAALPALSESAGLEARTNLAAALVRLGRVREAITCLDLIPKGLPSSGWAWLHRANARRFSDDLDLAVREAETAYTLAARDEDGYLAVAALCVKGEALLDGAVDRGESPKEAVSAFGKALGISELLGEEASALALAGLAHAHAIWGNQQKALEGAEKAFKRARAAHDPSATIRALLALYATTRIGSFARNALNEARAAHHKPFELLAALCVLEKERSAELLETTLQLARDLGCGRLLARAEMHLEQA